MIKVYNKKYKRSKVEWCVAYVMAENMREEYTIKDWADHLINGKPLKADSDKTIIELAELYFDPETFEEFINTA